MRSFRIAGPDGERTVKAGDSSVTYLTTALEPTRCLPRFRYHCYGEDRLGSAEVCAGMVIRHGGRRCDHDDGRLGKCSGARIVLFVSPDPIRAHRGRAGCSPARKLSDAVFEQAGKKSQRGDRGACRTSTPRGEYRRHWPRCSRRVLLPRTASAPETESGVTNRSVTGKSRAKIRVT